MEECSTLEESGPLQSSPVSYSASNLQSSNETESETPSMSGQAQSNQRKRRRTDPYAVHILEKLFAKNRHPSPRQRDQIATALGMDSHRVRIWFQNRRARSKPIDMVHQLEPAMSGNASEASDFNQILDSAYNYTQFPSARRVLPVETGTPLDQMIKLSGEELRPYLPEESKPIMEETFNDSGYRDADVTPGEIFPSLLAVPDIEFTRWIKLGSPRHDLIFTNIWLQYGAKNGGYLSVPLGANSRSRITEWKLEESCEEGKEFNSALWACSVGDLEFLKTLVQVFKKDLMDAYHQGWSCLHAAIFNGHAHIVKYLLQIRGDLDLNMHEEKTGHTPLHIAASQGFTSICLQLLAAGAKINVLDFRRRNPVHLSVENEDEHTTALLIMAKADVHMKDIDGNNCLMKCSSINNTELTSTVLNLIGQNPD